MNVLEKILLLGLCVHHGLLAQTEQKPQSGPPPTPFSTLVRENFDRWDHNHDGQLTTPELDLNVLNPHIRGDAAAALAELKSVQRYNADDHKQTPPLTLDALAQYELAIKRHKRVEHDYDENFRLLKSKLDQVSRQLFPDKLPRLTSIHQGDLGDCYFLSMVGALASQRPHTIVEMIKDNADGTYSVKFPGAKLVTIKAPTDTEISLGSTAGSDGLWVVVLEKAFGKLANIHRRPGRKKKEVTDVIAHGGSTDETIPLLTSHSCDGVDKQLGVALEKAFAHHRLVSTSPEEGREPPELYSSHVYAVIGFDFQKKVVTVYDCDPEEFTPKGPPGLKNGYPFKDGVFTMPLHEFIYVFKSVNIENNENAKARFE